MTILLAVDESNMKNGGLEVVDGSHEINVPLDAELCITQDWINSQQWTPVELEPGTTPVVERPFFS